MRIKFLVSTAINSKPQSTIEICENIGATDIVTVQHHIDSMVRSTQVEYENGKYTFNGKRTTSHEVYMSLDKSGKDLTVLMHESSLENSPLSRSIIYKILSTFIKHGMCTSNRTHYFLARKVN